MTALLKHLLKPALGLLVLCAGCTEATGPPPSDAARPPASSLAFVDVTDEAGLGGFQHETGAVGELWFPEIVGGGGGFIDYDSDGWMDIVLVGGAVWPGQGEPVPALRLYRNEGDGTFADRTAEVGLDAVTTYGFGLAVADYDNDGDDDFFLTTLDENLLFRNDDGVFAEVGRAAGLAGHAEWSTSALFFDADNDGWLDLYVGNYVTWSPETDLTCTLAEGITSYCTPELYEGLPGRFYRNRGDGTFAERTEEAGFAGAPGKAFAVVTLDYNRDGWADLAVANDTERDLLYENQGHGRFVERGAVSGLGYDETGKARAGMGIDAGIVDSTRHTTVFVANFSREMIGVYQHQGDGLFVDRARAAQIGSPSLNLLTFGLFLFDADLDGHLDLFTANGHINPEIEQVQEGVPFRQPARLFRNRGDATFETVLPIEEDDVWNLAMVARGAAYADYDRDGDLDLLIMENGGPAYLWRNDLEARPVLRVQLEGRASNRNGIGAWVVADVDGRRLERYVRSGASYLSHSETTVTLGLGAAAHVDSLWVYWPSGTVDAFADVRANQAVRVVEGTDGYDRRVLSRPALAHR